MAKQYFSKTKRRWMTLKSSDSETLLRKYKYRIREKPKVKRRRLK